MSRQYTILLDDEEITVQIHKDGQDYVIQLGDKTHRYQALLGKNPIYSFLVDDSKVLEAEVSFNNDACDMNIGHVPYHLEIFDPRRRIFSQSEHGGAGAGGTIVAPMPGKVVDVKVSKGDMVRKGQAVIVVEAMKMQNELPSAIDGKVEEIAVKAGDTVESGQKLIVIVK